MKINLEAISPVDGVAIVRGNHVLRLLRPPYLLLNCPVLPEESVRDAILRHGFLGAEEEFSNWDEAIDYLNKQVVEARRAAQRAVPEAIASKELFELAPFDVLLRFLDRTEADLIRHRHFERAERLLLEFLASKASLSNPELQKRAVALLQENKRARENSEAAVNELSSNDARFPSLETHGLAERARIVADCLRRRHSVFAPVS